MEVENGMVWTVMSDEMSDGMSDAKRRAGSVMLPALLALLV